MQLCERAQLLLPFDNRLCFELAFYPKSIPDARRARRDGFRNDACAIAF